MSVAAAASKKLWFHNDKSRAFRSFHRLVWTRPLDGARYQAPVSVVFNLSKLKLSLAEYDIITALNLIKISTICSFFYISKVIKIISKSFNKMFGPIIESLSNL